MTSFVPGNSVRVRITGVAEPCEGLVRCFIDTASVPVEPLPIPTPDPLTDSVLIGVELTIAKGSHDGEYEGIRFFHCPAGFGVWARPDDLTLTSGLSTAVEPALKASAVALLQKVFRRWGCILKERRDHLFEIWNTLDAREEAEVRGAHRAAMKLKQKLIQRKQRENMKNQMRKRLGTENQQEEEQKQNDSADSSSALDVLSSPDRSHYMIPVSPRLNSIDPSALAASLHRASLSSPNAPIIDHPLTPGDLLTLDYVIHLVDIVKAGQAVPLSTAVEILRRSKLVLKSLPNVVPIHFHSRLTIIGDLHGQISDLLAIFKLNGLPSARNSYLFNGDFCDRGQFSCEISLILLLFKCLFPKSVHLNRGNHESRDINSRDGFERECVGKYNSHLFDLFCDVFSCLPVAAVVENAIFVVHGGLPSPPPSIAEIDSIDRFQEIPESDSLLEHLLWSDPMEKSGIADSPRGAGYLFGPDITERFLSANHLRLIVRSHECFPRGYSFHHDERTISIFSASNYCGSVGNEGSFMILEKDLLPRIVPFYARPKEKLARYRMKNAILENEIVEKLLQRISNERLALTDHFMKLEKLSGEEIAARNKKLNLHTISRSEWCRGLQTILRLPGINFLEFQELLGLPKLGVDGTKNGPIDYLEFLLRFKPSNLMLYGEHLQEMIDAEEAAAAAKASGSPSSMPAPASPNTNLDRLLALLSHHKWELEALFRHFDSNGDGRLSSKELREGLMNLKHLLGYEFSLKEIDDLLSVFDKNQDRFVSYEEFFRSFTCVQLIRTVKEKEKEKQIDARKEKAEQMLSIASAGKFQPQIHGKEEKTAQTNGSPGSGGSSSFGLRSLTFRAPVMNFQAPVPQSPSVKRTVTLSPKTPAHSPPAKKR